jgi:hypothetical protein
MGWDLSNPSQAIAVMNISFSGILQVALIEVSHSERDPREEKRS